MTETKNTIPNWRYKAYNWLYKAYDLTGTITILSFLAGAFVTVLSIVWTGFGPCTILSGQITLTLFFVIVFVLLIERIYSSL